MSLLNSDEKDLLLRIARQALEAAVRGVKSPQPDLSGLPTALTNPGSSFVTLTIQGELRGCIGSLEPTMSLAEDVREHSIASALDDYRFPPVRPDELPEIMIEISCLSLPQKLPYSRPQDLPILLRPGIDGVVIRDGIRRATFLPQVWEKIPDPEEFLSHLCMKMGASPNLWKQKLLQVETYQVEDFHESSRIAPG